jgi:hypothetical protein
MVNSKYEKLLGAKKYKLSCDFFNKYYEDIEVNSVKFKELKSRFLRDVHNNADTDRIKAFIMWKEMREDNIRLKEMLYKKQAITIQKMFRGSRCRSKKIVDDIKWKYEVFGKEMSAGNGLKYAMRIHFFRIVNHEWVSEKTDKEKTILSWFDKKLFSKIEDIYTSYEMEKCINDEEYMKKKIFENGAIISASDINKCIKIRDEEETLKIRKKNLLLIGI